MKALIVDDEVYAVKGLIYPAVPQGLWNESA